MRLPIGSQERLRRIEAVTDATLSRLDVVELLDELLERVRDVMGVDTAAILLLEPHARQLVATAAKGLEEEVRSGLRIPVGSGFAGTVAARREPVVLEDVRPQDVVNPLLIEKGVRSLLGVPLIAADTVIGVLHVGTLTRRRFTDEDVHLLQLVADRATIATQARLSRVDRTAALALQRSLLPTTLPEVGGIDLAARYVPGHDAGVGGDWYDVFVLPSGWLGVVVGDVSGHGLRAAVVMGRLRSALRAYALECDDPADALTRLDRKIRHFEADSLATALYAMISPDGSRVVVSLAGHLPPLLATPDGQVQPVTVPADHPLGFAGGTARRSTALAFPAGGVLVCYTDGLVERRGEVIDVGVQRLIEAVRPDGAEAVCAAIMAQVSGIRADDDIALLAIHRAGAAPGSPERAGYSLVLTTDFAAGEVADLRRRVRTALRPHGFVGAQADDLLIAVNEIASNAVRHGGGAGSLRVWAGGDLLCEITDRGNGFDPAGYLDRAGPPAPTPTGGLGLWIARKTTERLTVNSGPTGTTVRMVAVPRRE
jgi:sigma-B regulation protein RsbU (phosphoserine phosphatase)